MNLKYHSQFLLDKEKDKLDARTRYRIKWEGNIVAFNLGYRIEVEKWSNETQRCKANTTHGKKKIPASVINRKLQLFEQACEDTIKYFEVQKIVPTKEQFQSVFNSNIGREKKVVLEKSFFQYYDDFMAEEGAFNQWTEATKTKLKVIRNHLFNFDSELTFEKLTEQKFIEYLNYLQRELKLKNSTILKHISFVKWFLRWSCRKGYNTNTFFEVFKPKLKDTQKKVIFLTPTEFKQFREYQIPEQKKYLERVRDVFLFQCFTGLRYSDVENLKKSDIRDNFIEVTTIKTSDSLKIELNQHSRGILEKYKEKEIDLMLEKTYNSIGGVLKEYEKEKSIEVKIDLYKCLRNFVQESSNLKKYEKIKFAEDVYFNGSKENVNLIVEYLINLVKRDKNLKEKLEYKKMLRYPINLKLLLINMIMSI